MGFYDIIQNDELAVWVEWEGSHIFHQKWLNDWIQVKLTWPAWRADLRNIYRTQYQLYQSISEYSLDDNFLYIEDFMKKFGRYDERFDILDSLSNIYKIIFINYFDY